MPRPDRPLSPGADPVQQLASDLRKLRDQAGSPTYQALARKTQAGPSPRSSTTLSDAAGGQTCPSWDTLVAYVTACGGRPGEWRNRWQQAQLWRQTSPAPTTSLDPAADHPPQPVDQVLDHQQSPGRESADCDGDPAADRQAVDPPSPGSLIRSGLHLSALTSPLRSVWWRQRRVIVAAAAFITAAVLGVVAVMVYSGPIVISGTVTCADGGAVVGVWVKAEGGDSGYASYLQHTDPHLADFQYRLARGARWTVNVGCGGTTLNWLHEVHGVTLTTATQQNWTCDSDLSRYGCRTQ